MKELLVIGDNAERLHALGGGSAEIKALYEISPLMGLKSQLGGNTKVTYARGYYVSPKEESEEILMANGLTVLMMWFLLLCRRKNRESLHVGDKIYDGIDRKSVV